MYCWTLLTSNPRSLKIGGHGHDQWFTCANSRREADERREGASPLALVPHRGSRRGGRVVWLGRTRPALRIRPRASSAGDRQRLHVEHRDNAPGGVESYGAYAMGAWLTPGVSASARRFARWSAIGPLALGMAGQVINHLLSAAHAQRAPWPVVALGVVPSRDRPRLRCRLVALAEGRRRDARCKSR
jgi:hypothetical protein